MHQPGGWTRQGVGLVAQAPLRSHVPPDRSHAVQGWVHRADGSDHGHPEEVWPISESDPMNPTLHRPKHARLGPPASSLCASSRHDRLGLEDSGRVVQGA